jgi:DnaJ-domain-containing protein 1
VTLNRIPRDPNGKLMVCMEQTSALRIAQLLDLMSQMLEREDISHMDEDECASHDLDIDDSIVFRDALRRIVADLNPKKKEN